MAGERGDNALMAMTALGTAGAIAADCVTTGGAFTMGAVLTKALEFTGGLGTGVVSEKLRARLGPARDLADIHRNHHLEGALRQAVRDVLLLAADDLDDTRDADALRFVAETGTLPIRDAPALVTEIFARTAAAGPENPLDADGWRRVLDALTREAKGSPTWSRERHRLSDDAREAAVHALAEQFPAALRNGLVADGPASPAFAKVTLLMMGEMVALLRDRPDAGALADDVASAQQEFRDALPSAIRDELAPLIVALDDILSELQAMRVEMRRGFERLAKQQLDQAAERDDGSRTEAPLPVDAFTGRGPLVADLVDRLDAGRALGLTGMGGIGKTEVARAVAHEVSDRAPAWAADGVWYADLSAARSPDDLLQTILSEWPVEVQRPSGRTVGAVLDAPRLYVLDDVEQALHTDERARDVRTLLRELMEYAPSARFLVTSRRTLNLPGLVSREIDHLDPDAARTLFDRLAREAGYTYADGDAERRDTLLGHLDGVPLAITLMAALLDDYDLTGLLRRWDQKATRATEAPGILPSKAESLHVSLHLSHDALPDEATSPVRSLFALFRELPAGATPSLLEAVFGDDGQDAAVVLVRRGLLRRDGDRRAMRVPVRAFAAECETADLPERIEALDAYLLALARDFDERKVKDDGTVYGLFEAELPTLRAAMDRMDAAGTAALIGRLLRWLTFVRPPGVQDWIEAGLRACEAIGASLGAANCRKSLGDVHLGLGEYGPARTAYTSALSAFEEIGASLGAANCRKSLGDVHLQLGEYGAARTAYTSALSAYEAIGDRLGAANCRQSLGDVHLRLGEYGAARDLYTAALSAFEALGSLYGRAQVLLEVGKLEKAVGDEEAARAAWRETERILLGLGLDEHPILPTLRGWLSDLD